MEGTRRVVLTPLTLRRLRLASGLTLFVYVTTHLFNHALGLHSIAAAESGLRVALFVWHSPVGTVLLYGAFAIHIGLAMTALYAHRTLLRMPALELLRIVLGLGIPTLLIGHAVATRLAYSLYGHEPTYAQVVWSLWHSGRQGWQLALLVPGWLHGCLGIDFAFSRNRRYLAMRPGLRIAACALPLCAVLGFLAMGAEVETLVAERKFSPSIDTTTEAESRVLVDESKRLLAFYAAMIALVLMARTGRRVVELRKGRLVAITYPGRTVRVPVGWSVLEASRLNGIPHRSACGGRGRCATCRVRVVEGLDRCAAPHELERQTLDDLALGGNTRLACQLRPQGDVRVELSMPGRSNTSMGA